MLQFMNVLDAGNQLVMFKSKVDYIFVGFISRWTYRS